MRLDNFPFFLMIYYFNLDFYFFNFLSFVLFYWCSRTVVSTFPPPLSPTPPNPSSHPQSYPLSLCPWVLYTCSLMTLPLISSIIPLFLPSGTLFVLYFNVWLYFACLLVLFIRFHLQVRSYGICLLPPGLFHLA